MRIILAAESHADEPTQHRQPIHRFFHQNYCRHIAGTICEAYDPQKRGLFAVRRPAADSLCRGTEERNRKWYVVQPSALLRPIARILSLAIFRKHEACASSRWKTAVSWPAML